MSIAAINWALNQNTGSPVTKLVLIKLADNANDEGKCWPSIKHVADHCELSDRSVREHVKKLADAGFLTVIPRSKDGVKLPNVYQLHLRERAGVLNVVQDPPERGAGPLLNDVPINLQLEPSIEPSLLPLAPQADEATTRKKKRKPEIPMPENTPTEEDKRWATAMWKSCGVSCDVDSEVGRFRDHHAARDSRFRDWDAAWRTWARNVVKFNRDRGGGQPGAYRRDARPFSGNTEKWD